MLAMGTRISCRSMEQVEIEKLVQTEKPLEEIELDTPYGLQIPSGVVETGRKPCIMLTTLLGHTLKLTPDHHILGYKNQLITKVAARDIQPNQDIAVLIQAVTGDSIAKQDGRRDFLYPPALREKARANKAKMASGQHLKKADITKDQTEWFRVLRRQNAYSDVIAKVEEAGELQTYDVWHVEKGHVFYANGFVVFV